MKRPAIVAQALILLGIGMLAALQAGAGFMTAPNSAQAQVHAVIQQGLQIGFPVTGSTMTIVPEPSGMLLLGISLSGLSVVRLRGNKQTA